MLIPNIFHYCNNNNNYHKHLYLNKKDEFDLESLNSLSLGIVPEYICMYKICISNMENIYLELLKKYPSRQILYGTRIHLHMINDTHTHAHTHAHVYIFIYITISYILRMLRF